MIPDLPSCRSCTHFLHQVDGQWTCWRYPWCKGSRRRPAGGKGGFNLLYLGPGGYYEPDDAKREKWERWVRHLHPAATASKNALRTDNPRFSGGLA
jgi:hypothetical protein